MQVKIMTWSKGNKNDCSEAHVIANAKDQHTTQQLALLRPTVTYNANKIRICWQHNAVQTTLSVLLMLQSFVPNKTVYCRLLQKQLTPHPYARSAWVMILYLAIDLICKWPTLQERITFKQATLPCVNRLHMCTCMWHVNDNTVNLP